MLKRKVKKKEALIGEKTKRHRRSCRDPQPGWENWLTEKL